jgi:hypothetical protein
LAAGFTDATGDAGGLAGAAGLGDAIGLTGSGVSVQAATLNAAIEKTVSRINLPNLLMFICFPVKSLFSECDYGCGPAVLSAERSLHPTPRLVAYVTNTGRVRDHIECAEKPSSAY